MSGPVLALALWLSLAARAADDDQVQRNVLILARVMAYDRTLLTDPGENIIVGVVYDPSLPASAAEASRTLAVFSSMPMATIGAKSLTAKGVALDDLDAQIEGVSTLYLCAGLEEHLSEILSASRAQGRLTLTTQAPWVEAGVSVGVRWNEGRATIRINLPASKQESVAFTSDLLKLAEVIR